MLLLERPKARDSLASWLGASAPVLAEQTVIKRGREVSGNPCDEE